MNLYEILIVRHRLLSLGHSEHTVLLCSTRPRSLVLEMSNLSLILMFVSLQNLLLLKSFLVNIRDLNFTDVTSVIVREVLTEIIADPSLTVDSRFGMRKVRRWVVRGKGMLLLDQVLQTGEDVIVCLPRSVNTSVELEVTLVEVEASTVPASGESTPVRLPVLERNCLVLEPEMPLGIVSTLDPVIGLVLVRTPSFHRQLSEHAQGSPSRNTSGRHCSDNASAIEADVLV